RLWPLLQLPLHTPTHMNGGRKGRSRVYLRTKLVSGTIGTPTLRIVAVRRGLAVCLIVELTQIGQVEPLPVVRGHRERVRRRPVVGRSDVGNGNLNLSVARDSAVDVGLIVDDVIGASDAEGSLRSHVRYELVRDCDSVSESLLLSFASGSESVRRKDERTYD